MNGVGKPRLRGIVLDLDDTLYLEQEYVRSGFLAVACGLAHEPEEAELYGQWLIDRAAQQHDGRTFNHLLDAFPELASRKTIAEMVKVYREHTPVLTLSDDWKHLLEAWRQKDLFLGLISDGELIGQERKVKALGLAPYFDKLVLTDSLGKEHWKPSATAFKSIEESSGLTAAGLVYIGDNVLKDFVAPNALGWHSIRLRMKGQVRSHIEPEGLSFAAEREVDSLTVLSEVIEGWL